MTWTQHTQRARAALRFTAPWALVGAVAMALCGCGGGAGTTVVDPTKGADANGWAWSQYLPANFPTPAVPANNPMSEAKFQLGRHLFYDKRLSGNGTYACASCHLQSLAFTDGLAVSVGSTGEHTLRSAPSIANAAYHTTLTWANPANTTLEKQMEGPLFNTSPVEMGVNDGNRAVVLQRFKDSTDVDYAARFAAAFPGEADPINFTNIIKAIAAFERGVLTGGSKFERYSKGLATLSSAEQRGMNLFNGEKAECFHCHGSFNFSDQVNYVGNPNVDALFHNTGLYNVGDTPAGTFPTGNRGVYEQTARAADMGAFRAQSLFNVGLTAPYMHDGSIATLEGVLDFYASGGRNITSGPYAGDGRNNPYKSDLISAINLDAQEKADIVAFLRTLSDETLLTNPRYMSPFP